MKKVLVLGGGGFIGINLARQLSANQDYEITVADRTFGTRIEDHFPEKEEQAKLTVVNDDFSLSHAYNRLERQYDYVYMMAAVVGVNNCLKRPDEVIRVNTALVHHLLQWLRQGARIQRMLFASSSENYAGTTDNFNYVIPTPETVPLCIGDIAHPRFTYAVTKMLGESAFLNCGRMMGFETTVVRYQNVFGPDMGFKHVIPHLVQRFCSDEEEPFKIYGAEQTRAFCYIDDAVDGTIRAMESPRASGEVYHIGNDEEISMEQLTRAVGDIMDYRGAYAHAPTYPGSVGRRCPDISKCRQQLGYAPKVHWRDGLQRTVEWYREYFVSGQRPVEAGFEPPDRFRM